jgi:hypothetical protein
MDTAVAQVITGQLMIHARNFGAKSMRKYLEMKKSEETNSEKQCGTSLDE